MLCLFQSLSVPPAGDSTALWQRSRLLIKCSFLSLAIKLCAFKRKKSKKKKKKKKKPVCNRPPCSLFLLISPQQFHPLCRFRLAGPQRHGCGATLCLLEGLLSVLVVKGRRQRRQRWAAQKKHSNVEKTSVTCGKSQTDGGQFFYFLQLRLREISMSCCSAAAVSRPAVIALISTWRTTKSSEADVCRFWSSSFHSFCRSRPLSCSPPSLGT